MNLPEAEEEETLTELLDQKEAKEDTVDSRMMMRDQVG